MLPNLFYIDKNSGRWWQKVAQRFNLSFEKVSQFWNYKPEEYLKNPVYDRNFPPCKYC